MSIKTKTTTGPDGSLHLLFEKYDHIFLWLDYIMSEIVFEAVRVQYPDATLRQKSLFH